MFVRALVITPTYNEAENITTWVERVRAALPDAAIMIVDDSSPDGTAARAEVACVAAGNAQVVVRPEKNGLGNAYRHAFDLALRSDAEMVLHLDADLSHDPAVLPAMVAAIERGAEFVIGSRYVPGGATENWPLHRRLLSKWGNRYTAAVVGLHVHDITSGFRAYTVDAVKRIEPGTTTADGYAFLTELAVRAHDLGLQITEVPIVFRDRTYGTSKMSVRIISESMLLVTRWGVSRRVRRRLRRAA
jgi:dolichol-phosphate mannosyltransferase